MQATLYDDLEAAVKFLPEWKKLPPLISFAVTNGGVYLQPWIHGAPVTALLAWADEMTNRACYVEIFGEHTSIEFTGEINGIKVHCTGTTHHFVRTTSETGAALIDDLREIASHEEAFE
jgi:hypothetical protein